MLLPTIIFLVSLFILLIIFIPLGAKIMEASKAFSLILMLIIGLVMPFLIYTVISSKFEMFNYKWYHFIGIIFLIGAMNNGNVKGKPSKSAYLASTYLFLGVIVTSILLFWIS
jgi:hypothetical protein